MMPSKTGVKSKPNIASNDMSFEWKSIEWKSHHWGVFQIWNQVLYIQASILT